MFKGFVLSESLNDPTILNNSDLIYIKVEKHEDPKYPKFWHLYKISVSDEDMPELSEELAKNIKNEWYTHFWDKNKVYIILKDKVFCIPREENWNSKEYKLVIDYAIQHGINEKYLGFKIED